MNSKYKYLFKNVGLLTISNFGGKVLSFLLLPLYTNILTTKEYGVYDFYTVTVSLMVPLLTVSICDAVFRFSLDNSKNKNDIFTIGFRYSVIGCVIFAVIVAINYIFNIIPILNQYPLFLLLYFISTQFYNVLTACARGIDNIRDYAIAGMIYSASVLLLNILFLVVLKIGINGYFLAYILSNFISAFYLSARIKFHSYLRLRVTEPSVKKEMVAYSSPFILNSISWWINGVSDRYIVTWLCGEAANGVYSVAYKIPSIINTFESIFRQAWTLSAIKEFDESNKEFYSNMYKLYNFGLVFMSSGLIIFCQLLAKILYAKDFYAAWEYTPFLIISVLFGSLGGFIGGIFSASNDSRLFARTTTIGAVINILLNIILIKATGPIGAAISTMVSYCIVWAYRLIKSRKIFKFEINLTRDIIAYIILLAQAILLVTLKADVIKYAFEAGFLFIITVMYHNEFGLYYNKIKEMIAKRKGV